MASQEAEYSIKFRDSSPWNNAAGEGILTQGASLLNPDGIVAVGIWDLTRIGDYMHWRAQLEEDLKAAGFQDMRAEVLYIGFSVGKEGFMRFFWGSANPMPKDRQASFDDDLEKVKLEMDRLSDEKYDGRRKIPLSAALAVGRKPKAE